MTYEIYYPEQRQMLGSAVIRRARLMPEEAGDVTIETANNARVSIKDVIARGATPAPFVLVEAARFFGLRDADALKDLLTVTEGELIPEGNLLAERKRRRLYSPITGTVVAVDSGLIMLQEFAGNIELEAGLNGQVIEIRRGRGAVIETMGAILQGVWGNGKRAISTLRFEPSGGLEKIDTDELDLDFRGSIIITRQALRESSFNVIAEQSLAGIIAPSIEPSMMNTALNSKAAIMLTEGFGSQRMSPVIVQFFEDMIGRQATLDAAIPDFLEAHRPEVIINVPLQGERPTPPLINVTLQVGMNVRVVRGDGVSVFGEVIPLPRTAQVLENGMEALCAQVQSITGERLMVPLANIEIAGR
jgi:hypothetical protein